MGDRQGEFSLAGRFMITCYLESLLKQACEINFTEFEWAGFQVGQFAEFINKLADTVDLDSHACQRFSSLIGILDQGEVSQPCQHSGERVFQLMIQTPQEAPPVV